MAELKSEPSPSPAMGDSLSGRVLRSSTLNALEYGVRIVAMFIITPLVIAALGPENYGIWLLLMLFFGYFKLLDLGVSLSITRFIARELGGGNAARLSAVINSGRYLFRRMAVASLVLTILAALLCGLVVQESAELQIIRFVILIYGGVLSLRYLFQLFPVILKSHVRYDLIVSAALVKVVAQSVALWLLLSYGHGMLTLAVVYAASELLELLILAKHSRRLAETGRACAGVPDRSVTSDILRYSGVAFLNQLASAFRNSIDPIVVSAVAGVVSVPIYSIGNRFLVMLGDLVNALFGGQLLAAFSQLDSSSKDSWHSPFERSTRLCVAITTFGVLSLVFYGEAFIQRWLGDSFSASYTILLIMAAPMLFALMQYPIPNVLYAQAKHKKLLVVSVTGAIANGIFSIFLGLKYGIFGVVWATFGEMTAVYLLVVPLIFCRETGYSLRRYVKTLVLPLFFTGIPLLAYYGLVRRFIAPDYLRIATLGAVQILLFLPVFWWLICSTADRKMVLSMRKGG